MKKFVVFLLSLSTVSFAVEDVPLARSQEAVVAGEIAMLDNLIEVTKENLLSQQKLRDQIQNYRTLLTVYLKNENDKELLFKLVKVATAVSNTIKEQHLSQIFDQEFMSEINVFAQIGNKRGIPKP